MKKLLIATAAMTLMCGSAFAQGATGPAAQQDNMTKPGVTTDSTDKGSMNKGSMDKGSMEKGTTGMNKGTGESKNGTPTTRDGSNKNNN
jgi:pentapeptide MXKDX repeat protein